jgi:hypothetical protein
VAIPPGPGDVEVIQHGSTSRVLGAGRTRLLLVLLLTLGGAAAVVDRQVRGQESSRISRCVEISTNAVATATGRVSAMAGYLGPALASVEGRRREELLDLVSDYARPGRTMLLTARQQCSATRVWVFHDGLQRTREDCLRLLDGQLGFLDDVMSDGSRAYGARTVPRGSCRTT